MRLLFIHQNFPGQFRDIAPTLATKGHDVRAICSHGKPISVEVTAKRYEFNSQKSEGIHPLTKEIDEWMRRSELCAQQAEILKEEGWAPDVILGHPGWGETLLLKTIFPSSALALWPELWLGSEQMGQQDEAMTLQQWHYLKSKNGLVELAMTDAQIAIIPTKFQASSFPKRLQNKVKVLHEGVLDNLLTRNRLSSLTINNQIILEEDTPVVTFISRNLEPMRGFPTFMRALPNLQKQHKSAHVIVVGGEGVSYSSKSEDGRSWKTILMEELESELDLERIHFIPRLEHEDLIKIYLRSNLHVYLSNAFVLSWSLTEIMACGTPILGLNNEMMKELVVPGETGALYQGSEEGLGKAISDLLHNPDQLKLWGNQARQKIDQEYRLSNTMEKLEQILYTLNGLF